MPRRRLEIVNRLGLHARAAARFAETAERFDAKVTVSAAAGSVGGVSIMGLMMLGAGPGTVITVAARGPQAEAALDALAALVGNGFDEA